MSGFWVQLCGNLHLDLFVHWKDLLNIDDTTIMKEGELHKLASSLFFDIPQVPK